MENKKLTGPEMGRIRPEEYASLPRSGVVLVIDNVRSAFNVGSIFRSCDAFKADKLYLCGICATPPSSEIHKSALGAETSVPWEYVSDTLAAVQSLRDEGYTIISIEQVRHSVMLQHFEPQPGERYALVVGNEVEGVRQDVIDASDVVVEIPQFGSKHSLNVAVAAGVVLWHIAAAALAGK